ncbi:outer membrane protein assembly factor BamA [Natronoflexus pectinivorans]|uniref:Outer membrane protein assembly factor BamA n=1 Tax=Natronoflexus pectinivorans TaxID=682526 RepID=A0A4R2GN16_9BACT|nr:outer membrane protein assembly factor BamA [Natronoflexus pectinivorans]TCO10407.1 outer membrane protein insertion porin family [Natronoflexus pectinivorans]
MLQRFSTILFLFIISILTLNGQTSTPEISYSGTPRSYTIAGIEVVGDLNNDPQILANLSGLRVGQQITVPGDDITNAIKKYWDYGLFSDVKISAAKIEGRQIWLEIYLQERPRLSEINYTGLRRSEIDAVNDRVAMMRGSQVTPYLIDRAQRFIRSHFVERGFYNTEVSIVQRDDTARVNHVILDVHVDKKERVKVNSLTFEGNEEFTDNRLNRIMKKTNQRRRLRNFFRTKRFVEENYRNDLRAIIEKYNERGYRDAYIIEESVTRADDNTVDINIKIEEGDQYYFGNITWIGNTIYPGEYLGHVLRIQKGDIFNQTRLDERLFIDDDAVHNLYMNNGYLFSRIIPVDVRIENDTVDLEMRIFEGDQATINNVIIRGNTKTHEHVVRRELRTKPGELFNKALLIRTVRELAQLGHFDPEKIRPVPLPDPDKGTVDLEYNLEEKANDQIELSGGWGAGMFVGSLGLRFTNFSVRNFFNGEAWRPLPTGDGQTLSLRAQTNGRYYQAYSVSFMEPWLGGSKPNSLSVSLHRSIQTGVSSRYGSMFNMYGMRQDPFALRGDDSRHFKTFGMSVGLGRRLTWPDDYFVLYNELSYQHYDMKRWHFLMSNGRANNIKFRTVLSRRSIDNPLYTRSGSDFSLGLEFTPPYSWFSDKDYSTVTNQQELYRFIEYHKWSFKGSMFKTLDNANKLVIMPRIEAGFLGYYNKHRRSPLEQYTMGGDGMAMNFSYYGSENVGLRGYENNSLTAFSIIPDETQSSGFRQVANANIYNKMTLEMRYPLTLQPSATVYGLVFAEAGNSWAEFSDYNPFQLYRSAGVGLRIFLPMFGLLGIDWGYGFDQNPYNPNANGSNFHFVMGQNF